MYSGTYYRPLIFFINDFDLKRTEGMIIIKP